MRNMREKLDLKMQKQKEEKKHYLISNKDKFCQKNEKKL